MNKTTAGILAGWTGNRPNYPKTEGRCPDCDGPVEYSRFDWSSGVSLFRCPNYHCKGDSPPIPEDDLYFGPLADEFTPLLPEGGVVEYTDGKETRVGTVYDSYGEGFVELMVDGDRAHDVIVPLGAVSRVIPWSEFMEEGRND